MGKLKTPPRRKTTPQSTLADLLHQLGDIPAHRVLMQPPPGTAKLHDVDDPQYVADRTCELVQGVLVEKPMGFYEEYMGTRILRFFSSYLDQNDIGVLIGPDAPILFDSQFIFKPDVSFIRWDSVPDTDIIEQPKDFYLSVPPDLAVEVISPSNTKREMERKVSEYFKAGVRIVWLVYPETKTVDVLTKSKPKQLKTFTVNDTLDGGKVLPGFTLPVKTIFAPRAPKKS